MQCVGKCFLGSIDHKRAQKLRRLLSLASPTHKCNFDLFGRQVPQNKRNHSLRNPIVRRRVTEPMCWEMFPRSIDHKQAQNLERVLSLAFATHKCNFDLFLKPAAPKQTQPQSPQSNCAKESDRANVLGNVSSKH